MKKYGVTEKSNVKRTSKGITLTALVVTVIVLLIISGITIASLSGNGILNFTGSAKERTEINSEMKIVGTAANQAKSLNKYGDLEEETFYGALNSNAGRGKVDVVYHEKVKVYQVTFKDSKRTYQVYSNGYTKYIGELANAIIIDADPRGSISLNEEYSVNITLESFGKDIDDVIKNGKIK